MAGGTVVGIDIGSQLMKVVEMRRSGGGLEVTALELAPTPQEAIDNGLILDAKLLGGALRELLNKAHVSAKKSVSSLSGQSGVVVRVVETPQVDEKKLDEQMRFEAERQVPFALSESIMDYAPLPRPAGSADGDLMEVLFAVAQSDLVDKHVEALFEAKLKPEAIDVEPLALGRALLELNPATANQSEHTAVLVNIGASNTDIGVYRNSMLIFPRSVPMAGDQLTRSIADYMQVDLQTAEQYKREYGEVLFEQLQSQPTFTGQQDTSTFATSGGGFVDFSTQEFATPSPSGSGKMPFDFSTPGDAPTFNTEDHLPQQGTEEVKGTADTGEMPHFNTAEIGGFAVPGANLTGTAEVGGFSIPGSSATAPITGVPAVPGTGDPTRDALRAQVFNCIAPVLAEIVQEIRRSIEYYRGRANNAQVDEILLTGGTANLKNLAPFIEQETGVRTRVANPLQYVQVSTKNHSPEALNEMASLFSIAIGLGAYSLLSGAKKRR